MTSLSATETLLVIGSPGLVDGLHGDSMMQSVLVAAVPSAAATPRQFENGYIANTVLLSWSGSDNTDVVALGSSPSERRHITWRDLFTKMLPGNQLREVAASVGYAGPLLPQLLIEPTADNLQAHVYTRLRLSPEDALFIRVTSAPLDWTGTVTEELLLAAAAINDTNHLFLNNHQCYYRRHFPGEELEHKYTFTSGNLWDSTVDLYNRLKNGDLKDFVPEYKDEFQTWDYDNFLHDVPEPADEQGYVSFIPLVQGGYTVKRKWFGDDAFRRGERMTRESDHIPDYVQYLKDTMGISAHALPPFRRVRYDVNFESLKTGHVYGIFFDQVTIKEAPRHTMMQCEMEYLRTRSVVDRNDGEILEEMEEIAVWLERYLLEKNITSSRGTFSKLSFLRDAVDKDPELGERYVRSSSAFT